MCLLFQVVEFSGTNAELTNRTSQCNQVRWTNVPYEQPGSVVRPWQGNVR